MIFEVLKTRPSVYSHMVFQKSGYSEIWKGMGKGIERYYCGISDDFL
jgi:hypothetical protein